MKKKTIEIAVGTFFLLAILSFSIFIFKISGIDNIYDENSTYDVHAEFSNVGNLKVNSKVSISGVCVGRVKSIYLDKNYFYAKVCLSIKSSIDNIPDDTKASILTSGLLGDNYVDLNIGFSTDFLKHNDSILIENTDSAIIFEKLIYNFIKR